jgi:hypothetical protein
LRQGHDFIIAARTRTAKLFCYPYGEGDSRAQFVWHANWVEEQVTRHVAFGVALKVMNPEGVAVVGVGGAGRTHPVWQFAACELQDIMQFVTVEVTTGGKGEVKGAMTVGAVGVVACARTASCETK